jgi:hypothetical protein
MNLERSGQGQANTPPYRKAILPALCHSFFLVSLDASPLDKPGGFA